MGKPRTKAATRRKPTRPAPGRASPRPTPRGLIGACVAVIAGVVALVVWQAGRDGGDAAETVALTHVHGLGINPADGNLYVATHDGLYQLPVAGGTARLVGRGRQDTMGFTIAGPDLFLASGHPAPGQGGPKHLGLIESTDAGVTWTTRSLPGDADFHVLRVRHDTVFGYNSVRGQLIASDDKATWQSRATLALRDFDIHPTDPRTLLATTDTGLRRSTDGGITWAPAGGPPLLLLAWETADRLWGVTPTGDILRSVDAGAAWSTAGKLAGQMAAFTAHDGILFAAVHERGIYRSSDGGGTWSQIYGQAG